MSLVEFGPFARVWLGPGEVPVPEHLELLWLESDGARTVVDRVARALVEPEPQRWIDAMLDDPNWRPHLVAALAYLLDDERRLDCRPLWRAMDAGSWVIPQLAVTACYVDADFVRAARDRVARRCPVRVPAGLTPVERHVATGPIGGGERSAKLLVSLLTASEEIPELASWAASVRADGELQAMLSADASDGAATIVTRWREQVRLCFRERGVELRPPARR
jgi:hypothetical protein